MKDIYMEDINSAVLRIMEVIEASTYNKISSIEEDLLLDRISEIVEKLCKYPDYRNYN